MNITQGITLKDAFGEKAPTRAGVVARPQTDAVQYAALAARVDRVCGRIAPLWPLKQFVAVNPFLGMSDLRFEQAAATMERIAGARMTMPRAFYREQLADSHIMRDDLRQALPPGGSLTLHQLEAALHEDSVPMKQAATVAEVLDTLALPDAPQGGFVSLVTDKISQLCAARFDDGQALWPLPWKEQSLYLAWRASAAIDLAPEAHGIRHFRAAVAALPDDPLQAIGWALRALRIPDEAADDYLHCALSSIGGWAAWTRYRQWQQVLRHGDDRSVVDLLAVRVAWDALLYDCLRDPALDSRWRQAVARMAQPGNADRAELAVDLALQRAFEIAYQRRLAATLAQPPIAGSAARAAVQAVFCIDVRSEVLRRALESVTDRAQTLGFAGFFGLAIDYRPLGSENVRAQCPVLLAPGFEVQAGVPGADAATLAALAGRRRMAASVAALWKGFRASAVSCFSFVEAFGPLFAFKLLRDGLGWRSTAADTRRGDDGVACAHGHGCTGNAVPQAVDSAEKILRGMSLTRDFARLVLLVGHGSSSVNNPHASGLDCGACGGHSGEANARLAAQLLNDAEVRAGLVARGIAIPEDTLFVAALHDTTVDAVMLYDTAALPASHAADLAQLRQWLSDAGALARRERVRTLDSGVPAAQADAAIRRRSRDWSQVRPEWGLAGNAAFIAAPRSRTRGIDLGGRAFLHEYDWRSDSDFKVLELVMTAPMVVGSWINLQYYGSSVDNRAFGAGNKVLHNVVGATLGVFEGNGGDLCTGLPLQSLHDGKRWVHEPLRMSVYIEAPDAAIDAVIEKHASVRELVANGWLHLFRIAPDGSLHQWQAARHWVAFAAPVGAFD